MGNIMEETGVYLHRVSVGLAQGKRPFRFCLRTWFRERIVKDGQIAIFPSYF